MLTPYANRRDFLRAVITGAAGLTISYKGLGQGAPSPITATKLSSDLAVLMGDGGNVAVIISDSGLMLIDGGLPDRSAHLIKTISDSVDSHKITTLFNTHWHFDHTGSN